MILFVGSRTIPVSPEDNYVCKSTSERRALPSLTASPFPAQLLMPYSSAMTYQVSGLCSLVPLVFAYSAPFGWNVLLCFPDVANLYSSLELSSTTIPLLGNLH